MPSLLREWLFFWPNSLASSPDLRRNIRLLILGDGPLRNYLNELIIELNLENCISLMGYVDNPLKYFKAADLFVLSSNVEGMPNVLVEALMCGCTVVSTDCPTGPNELLKNNKYGYLVPVQNSEALASAIDYALNNKIKSEIINEIIYEFEEKNIINQHFTSLKIY